MKEDNRNYIAVGAFVLSMLVALIVWFAALSGMAVSTDGYYILWDNVMGLKPGTQILFEGYQIGLIESIERSPEADSAGPNFRVEIEIDKGWPIPESAEAETTAPSFLAALVVNIRAGDSEAILQPGSLIRSKEQGDLLSAAGDAMSKISEVLDFMKPKLEEITNSVSSLLSDENSKKIQSMLETLNARVDEALGTVSELIDRSGSDVGHALADLRASLGAVSRHIDAIARNLEDTTRNANEFSEQIRKDPSVLLRGRDSADNGAK